MSCKRFIISFVWLLPVILLSGHVLLSAQTANDNPHHLSPDHATVSVADWDKECQWYQRVLGFHELKQAKRGPDRQICYLGIPGYRIDVLWQKGSIRHQVTTGSLEQGWLNVELKTSDIDAVYKYITEQGIKVTVDRGENSSIQHLKFLDPEGNEIGITP
jgi:catechol 2,3-dioxygenase-like lactoylglutathione lyase family enzyme